jgi:hypothetical protein
MDKRAVLAVTGPEGLEDSLALDAVASPPDGFEGCEHPESKKMSRNKKMAAVRPVANHVLDKGSMTPPPAPK